MHITIGDVEDISREDKTNSPAEILTKYLEREGVEGKVLKAEDEKKCKKQIGYAVSSPVFTANV